MSIDIQKLKALAESAIVGDKPASTLITELIGAMDSFRAAANPAAVLELIAEIGRLTVEAQKLQDGWCRECDGTGDLHTLDGEWHGECPYCEIAAMRTLKHERDQLKAENEALRKDAERLEWLDGKYTNVVEGHGEYAELVAIRWVVEGQCSTVRDAIDDAMSKDATHE